MLERFSAYASGGGGGQTIVADSHYAMGSDRMIQGSDNNKRLRLECAWEGGGGVYGKKLLSSGGWASIETTPKLPHQQPRRASHANVRTHARTRQAHKEAKMTDESKQSAHVNSRIRSARGAARKRGFGRHRIGDINAVGKDVTIQRVEWENSVVVRAAS